MLKAYESIDLTAKLKVTVYFARNLKNIIDHAVLHQMMGELVLRIKTKVVPSLLHPFRMTSIQNERGTGSWKRRPETKEWYIVSK